MTFFIFTFNVRALRKDDERDVASEYAQPVQKNRRCHPQLWNPKIVSKRYCKKYRNEIAGASEKVMARGRLTTTERVARLTLVKPILAYPERRDSSVSSGKNLFFETAPVVVKALLRMPF